MEKYYLLIENSDGEIVSVEKFNTIDEITSELSSPFYEDLKWHILIEIDDRVWEFNRQKDQHNNIGYIGLAIIITLIIIGTIIRLFLVY